MLGWKVSRQGVRVSLVAKDTCNEDNRKPKVQKEAVKKNIPYQKSPRINFEHSGTLHQENYICPISNERPLTHKIVFQ